MSKKVLKWASRIFLCALGVFIIGLVVSRSWPNIVKYTLAPKDYVYASGLDLKQSKKIKEFFSMDCDKDLDNLTEGEEFTLIATDESELIVNAFNYFTLRGYNILSTHQVRIASLWNLEYSSPNNSDFFDLVEDLIITAQIKKALYDYDDKVRQYANKDSESKRSVAYLSDGFEGDLHATYIYVYFLPNSIEEKILWKNEYGMDLKSYIEYGLFYQVGIEQLKYPLEYDGSTPLICDTETEKTVSTINQMLWDEKWYEDSNVIETMEMYMEYYLDDDRLTLRSIARETASSYGFSEDNPITVEWVEQSPAEAFSLYRQLPFSISATIIFYSSGISNNELAKRTVTRTAQISYNRDEN